jgi:type II secretory pathway pseudopilin PulG
MARGNPIRYPKQGGFSYLIVIFLVAVVAVVATHVQEITAMKEKRRKEAELLVTGEMYRAAIQDYYDGATGSAHTYPNSIADLLADPRTNKLVRHLRKEYPDPITGAAHWALVAAPQGGIMGVYSLSDHSPVKQDGFPLELAGLKGVKKYQDWKFVYVPQ